MHRFEIQFEEVNNLDLVNAKVREGGGADTREDDNCGRRRCSFSCTADQDNLDLLC